MFGTVCGYNVASATSQSFYKRAQKHGHIHTKRNVTFVDKSYFRTHILG